ncbi:hypothetical protein Tco_0580018, partial [Tanacetum coccineum]
PRWIWYRRLMRIRLRNYKRRNKSMKKLSRSGRWLNKWRWDTSGSRSTSLEEERGGGGTEGLTKVTPLQVVIALRSS